MNKIALLLTLFLLLLFSSCEEVVPVDLNTAPPKLVIEASIIWKKETTGNQQSIKLTTTTDYYSNTIPTVSGAVVVIKNSSNKLFKFIEIPKTGVYVCTDFKAEINETYTLNVLVNGATYTATETLRPVAPIIEITQNNQGGFTGKDIEIKAYYKDPVDQSNYYLYRYSYPNQVKSSYYVDQDQFFNGNTFFSISQNEDLKVKDTIEIIHYGISKAYYTYLNVLISITGSSTGGPFQSPPATVRGNIINTTNPTNYPLGYFSLSEMDSRKLIIQ